jgi:peptide/nickel transport system permease protein
MTKAELALETGAQAGYSPFRRSLHRLVRQRSAMIGLLLLILLVGSTLLAPVLNSYEPTDISPAEALQPPSAGHLMGTDQLGRDVMSRVLYGGRVSLRVGLIAVAIGAVVGIFAGVLAGFYCKWLDAFLSRTTDVLLAFPGILLALVVVAILGPGLNNVMIAVGISFIPSFMRVARGSVLSTRELEYVTAAHALGNTERAIMLRHILPNIGRPLLVLASLGVGTAILAGAALSFLGLGVQPPDPEWGAMLSTGQNYVREGWWMSVFPGLAIFLTVLAVNLFGDGLNDAMSPGNR